MRHCEVHRSDSSPSGDEPKTRLVVMVVDFRFGPGLITHKHPVVTSSQQGGPPIITNDAEGTSLLATSVSTQEALAPSYFTTKYFRTLNTSSAKINNDDGSG